MYQGFKRYDGPLYAGRRVIRRTNKKTAEAVEVLSLEVPRLRVVFLRNFTRFNLAAYRNSFAVGRRAVSDYNELRFLAGEVMGKHGGNSLRGALLGFQVANGLLGVCDGLGAAGARVAGMYDGRRVMVEAVRGSGKGAVVVLLAVPAYDPLNVVKCVHVR